MLITENNHLSKHSNRDTQTHIQSSLSQSISKYYTGRKLKKKQNKKKQNTQEDNPIFTGREKEEKKKVKPNTKKVKKENKIRRKKRNKKVKGYQLCRDLNPKVIYGKGY